MDYFLRSRSDLLAELKIRMRDTTNARWSEGEMGVAINGAIRRWANRVRIPFLYTLTTGLTTSSWTVALPDFIDHRFFRPQVQSDALSNYYTSLQVDTWVDLNDYTVEPDGSGGRLLRVAGLLYDTDLRVIHWVAPGSVPADESVSSPVVLLDSSTSMTVTTSENNLPECGFIKVNNEWIQYSGLADAGTTLTLSNLQRGIRGTTEATHSPDDTIDWGVCADRLDLFEQLFNQCAASLHQQFLAYASPQEREAHTFVMRYSQQLADEYWQSYASSYQPKLIMDLT